MEKTDTFHEVTPLSSEDCFVIFDRVKETFNFPIHFHPEFELNFIENAKGARRIVGDSIEEIENLELCLIGNERLEHGWVEYNNTSKQIHEITIQFHKDFFLNSLLSKKQFQSLSTLLENAKKGIAFSQQSIEKVKSRIDLLNSNQNGFYAVMELINILYELSNDPHYRILCNSTFTSENDTSESRRVQKLIYYIQLNFQKELHLVDVASYIGMSETSFSRFMKKRTGKSFVEYLIDFRLGIASKLLVNTYKSIAEITYECGFNNLSNFNRIFKKRKDCTPKEFRENYAKMRKFV